MRIWNEQLIPHLCQKHLCAMWREGLGAYKIIMENKKGYRNHPAVKEFINSPLGLAKRLLYVRKEMLKRGYHPKEISFGLVEMWDIGEIKPWQTLDEQIEVLKSKGCKCNLSTFNK